MWLVGLRRIGPTRLHIPYKCGLVTHSCARCSRMAGFNCRLI